LKNLPVEEQPSSRLFPLSVFLKGFLMEHFEMLSSTALSSTGEPLLSADLDCLQKDSPIIFFVSFLSSPEWYASFFPEKINTNSPP